MLMQMILAASENMQTAVVDQNPQKSLYLMLMIAALVLVVVIMVILSVYIMKKYRKNDEEENENLMFSATDKDKENMIFKERSIKSMLSMDGVDPNPLSYFVVNDRGMDCYIRSFYIHTMPKRVQFATTFAPLFDYDNCIASVFMEPIPEGKSIRQLDSRIVKIESEVTQAIKDGDRNRRRKMQTKLDKTEQWAHNIESGENTLYEVGFLFTIFAKTLEDLNLNTQKFIYTGRNKGIELCSCYGVHPEAFLSNAPFNHIFSLSADKYNLIKSTGIKMQIMDKYSLATVYHHTNSSFSHKNGIPAGRNLNTGEPMLYDPYDKSHNGYGVIFAGMTGTGKSATMKMYVSRLYHQHYRFVSIDSDRKGGRGEFSNIAEKLTGITFQIKNGSKYRINPFDIDEQLEWDEPTDTEFRTLRLSDKVANLTHIIMSIICEEDEKMDFNMSKSVKSIVRGAITALYAKRNIFDGEPNSIYEKGKVLQNGVLVDGKVKKTMPTLSDFYMQVVEQKAKDQEVAHEKAYTVIIDAMGDWVNHIIYNKKTLQVYTEEQALELRMQNSEEVENLTEIKGTKAYFDGQSTIEFNMNTSFTNIDISDLPKDDIPIAQEFACNFVEENFMKKNSENPRKAKKMVVICDEAHRMFRNKNTRTYLSDWYRTARKRHISIWTCTQALKDFAGYPETESIITNSTSMFLFKQVPQHEEYLRKSTILTASQIDKLMQIGGDPDDASEGDVHKGECCLIDNNRCVFIKVDYLSSERYIVETDIGKLQKMYA